MNINVDFFLKKTNSRGRGFLYEFCFLCLKNNFSRTSSIAADHKLIKFAFRFIQRKLKIATKQYYDFSLLYFGTVLATVHGFNF